MARIVSHNMSWISVFAFFLAALGIMEGRSAIMVQDRSGIIIFSHSLHVDALEFDCSSCHLKALESISSSDNLLPKMEDCMACHDGETASEECGTCHQDPDNPVAFVSPEREILFNHTVHLETQGLECAACHQGYNEIDYAAQSAHPFPYMADCMKCHDGVTAKEDCQLCHSRVESLLPVSHTPDWKRLHGTSVRSGDMSCRMCHDDTYCQECHDAVNLIEAHKKSTDRFSPYAPVISGRGSSVLKKVHDLNYRFTHAIDARSKSQDCRTCHELSTFCNNCHEHEGDFLNGKPAWHSGPDWGAISGAVGTGGGKHAQMAKRDISQCAACHDEQGEDPVCLMCHRDIRPGKGNDPKTHERNIGDRIGEDYWHEDDMAACYNCHQRESMAGIGFCGYCHGAR